MDQLDTKDNRGDPVSARAASQSAADQLSGCHKDKLASLLDADATRFYDSYYFASRPVVLRGLMNGWPALSRWSRHPLLFENKLAPTQWRAWYRAYDKSEIIRRLRRYPQVRAAFVDDTLYVQFATWAISRVRWGNGEAFVNSLLHALGSRHRRDIRDYGLRTDVPASILAEISHAASHHTYGIDWRKGDVLMVDNSRMMHGRRSFSGQREIIAVNAYARFLNTLPAGGPARSCASGRTAAGPYAVARSAGPKGRCIRNRARAS